jgi:cytochrome c553
MFFRYLTQTCLVVLAIMVLLATAASETGASGTGVDASSADTTATSTAAKAAQLLASMPPCGVCHHENSKHILRANDTM